MRILVLYDEVCDKNGKNGAEGLLEKIKNAGLNAEKIGFFLAEKEKAGGGLHEGHGDRS
jgi:hypothetical protein